MHIVQLLAGGTPDSVHRLQLVMSPTHTIWAGHGSKHEHAPYSKNKIMIAGLIDAGWRCESNYTSIALLEHRRHRNIKYT